MAKGKQSKLAQEILFAAGILFICAGIYFLAQGIHTYIQQFDQEDWRAATATVINVDERRGRHRHGRRYDIIYQYEALGTSYTGTIFGSNAAKNYGDVFEIKYDPEAPEHSTRYFEPTFGFVLSGIAGLLIFGFMGSLMVRSSGLLKKKAGSRKKSGVQPQAGKH